MSLYRDPKIEIANAANRVKGRPTLVASDAAPCGFNNVVSPAKLSAFQACLASDGGAARLNLTVGLV
jgi:hypothetical protein